MALRRCNRKKTCTVFSIFLCGFIIFFLRMPEFYLHDRQLLQDKIQFNNIKTIFEISHLGLRSSVRYNVKNVKNIVPESRTRTIKTAEKKLFKKLNDDIIVSLQGKNWTEWNNTYCSGNLYDFKKSIILMKNAIIDPSKMKSAAKGGEEIRSVIGNSEKDEEVQVYKGFFTIPCNDLPKVTFPKGSHYTNWFSGIAVSKRATQRNSTKKPFTVLIKRGDYANLFWTLNELYNTYLTIRLLGEYPNTTDVILMDAHPVGKLDNLWKIMFGNVYRIGHVSNKIFLNKLAWVISKGPMSQNVQNIPFVEEFKYALYQGVQNFTSLYHSCSDIQNVTFILRKDYVAHPRNPRGTIQRKIANEKQVLDYLKNNIPDVNINAIQIDMLPIEEQIKLIYETNILIGIHGAGLGHTLILRPGSTMIELFPSSYKRSPNPHFQQFAYWADVHYDRWYSSGPPKKNNEWVYVEPEIPYKLIKHAKKRSCKH